MQKLFDLLTFQGMPFDIALKISNKLFINIDYIRSKVNLRSVYLLGSVARFEYCEIDNINWTPLSDIDLLIIVDKWHKDLWYCSKQIDEFCFEINPQDRYFHIGFKIRLLSELEYFYQDYLLHLTQNGILIYGENIDFAEFKSNKNLSLERVCLLPLIYSAFYSSYFCLNKNSIPSQLIRLIRCTFFIGKISSNILFAINNNLIQNELSSNDISYLSIIHKELLQQKLKRKIKKPFDIEYCEWLIDWVYRISIISPNNIRDKIFSLKSHLLNILLCGIIDEVPILDIREIINNYSNATIFENRDHYFHYNSIVI